MKKPNAHESQAARKQRGKLALIGFLLMLAGPLLLYSTRLHTETFGGVSKTTALMIIGTAQILPTIGLIFSILSLFFWKKTTKWGRALSIVTVSMCNPYFFIVYLRICTSSMLWMKASSIAFHM